jgi:hypothetical protein
MRCGLIGLAFLVILKNLPYLAPSVTPICATTPLSAVNNGYLLIEVDNITHFTIFI